MRTIFGGAVLALSIATSGLAADRDYLTVEKTIEVARPADAVWKRFGDYCGIGELLDFKCSIEAGKGEVGTLRRLNGNMVESLVGKTAHSYTYSQLEGPRAGTDYHGTMAVEALGPNRSKLVYTVTIDRGRLPAGTNMAEYQKALEDRFLGVIVRAKSIIEGQR